MREIVLTLKTMLFTVPAITGWGPFVVTLLVCPIIIFLAPLIGLFDEPGSYRKIHKGAKPLGGTALIAGFLPFYMVFGTSNLPLVFGLVTVFLAGIADDLHELDPKTKLFLHLTAAIVVLSSGVFPATSITAGGHSLKLTGWLNSGFLVFWLVGGTNGFNLIDGLDGLATGIAIIALLPIIGLTPGSTVFLTAVMFLGPLAAVLFFNFHPAKLFLGDGGSYFVGFLTSYLVIKGLGEVSFTGEEVWGLGPGLLLLGFPILDTGLAIARRLASRQGIMEADKNHVHHQLLRRYGHTKAVLTIYGFQALLSGIASLLII